MPFGPGPPASSAHRAEHDVLQFTQVFSHYLHTHTHTDSPQVILMLTRQLNIPHARSVFAVYISQIFAKIVAVFKQLSTGQTDRQIYGQTDTTHID